jgi:hypothetical protein
VPVYIAVYDFCDGAGHGFLAVFAAWVVLKQPKAHGSSIFSRYFMFVMRELFVDRYDFAAR